MSDEKKVQSGCPPRGTMAAIKKVLDAEKERTGEGTWFETRALTPEQEIAGLRAQVEGLERQSEALRSAVLRLSYCPMCHSTEPNVIPGEEDGEYAARCRSCGTKWSLPRVMGAAYDGEKACLICGEIGGHVVSKRWRCPDA